MPPRHRLAAPRRHRALAPAHRGHGGILGRERLGRVLGSCSLRGDGVDPGASPRRARCSRCPCEAEQQREGAQLRVAVTGLQITIAV